MGAFIWPIGRITRGGFIGWLIGINLLVGAADYWGFGRLNLTLNLGFRFDALENAADLPIWRTALELVLDLLLAALAVARLHDASYSARWLALIVALAVAAILPFASALAVVALLGWIAIIVLPPSIGPNRFGPDPRGWTSRAHFDRQEQDLAEQGKR